MNLVEKWDPVPGTPETSGPPGSPGPPDTQDLRNPEKLLLLFALKNLKIPQKL